MKILFASLVAALIAASVGLYSSFPDVQTQLPVIYWVTDPNPAREEQVAIFHRWLIKQGHGQRYDLTSPEEVQAFLGEDWPESIIAAMREANPDGPKLWTADFKPRPAEEVPTPVAITVPLAELRLDSANRDTSKQIIQSVSGVAGDVMDMGPLHYFVELGVLADLTEPAKELGFSTDQTFEAIVPDITKDGRQYAFPCNVYTHMLWVNNDTFAKYGLQPPPRRWTLEEFEARGKEFVDAANPPGQPRRFFFVNGFDSTTLIRGMGLSVLNETMTGSDLDDPRFVRAMSLLHKWTYEDRILPSLADRQSFDTQSGYGGATMQLFGQGNYAMFISGRYAVIQLRRFPPINLSVSEPPHDVFPTTTTGTRCAGVYVDGNQRVAEYFLAYLASEDYNLQIVRDGDSLPPNPKYTKVEQFSRPPEYPREWGLHDVFADAALEIAVPYGRPPYAPVNSLMRKFHDAVDEVMANLAQPEDAARQAAQRINAEIVRGVAENPDLQERYERDVQRQVEIDRLRAAGEPVPLEWITNPFYRKYYQAKGWTK